MNAMRARVLLAVGCVVLAWCAARAAGGAGGVRTVELGNGLTVLVAPGSDGIERGDGADARVHIVIRRGSMHERGAQRGAALVAARAAMIHLAQTDRAALACFATGAEGARSGDGVTVHETHTVFRMRVEPGEGLGAALGVARELLGGFAPGEGVIEEARDAVIDAARARREDSARMHTRASALVELLGGSALSRVPLALEDELGALTSDAVRAYIDACWRAPAAVVTVVGRDVGDDAVRGALGGLARRDASVSEVDGALVDGAAGNLVVAASARHKSGLVGMVWFDERAQGAPARSPGEMAALALAGEAMRARVNRVVRGTVQGARTAGVTAGEIHGRVVYAQLIARSDPGAWRETMGALARERTRLVRDGVSAGEVGRARAIILRQWGQKVDRWSGGGAGERAAMLDAMIAGGRAGVDPGAWLARVRAAIETMDAERVNAAIVALIGRAAPATIVMPAVEPAPERGEVERALAAALSADVGALSARWRGPIVESVLDRAPEGGRIAEVRVHEGSGVTSARLGNGVWAHHRAIELGGDGPVHVRVHVALGEIEPAALSGAVRVVRAAMARGRLGSRLGDEVSIYLADHALDTDVELTAKGLTIGVRAPARSLRAAVEYVYALLTDLRIDAALIASIRDGAGASGTPIGALDRALLRGVGRPLDARRWDGFGDAVRAPAVTRWWRSALRDARIEAGVCGPVDAERALGACASVLGALREQGDVHEDPGADGASGGGALGSARVVEARDGSGRTGVAVGFDACARGDIDEVRALVIASMALRERLASVADGVVAGVVVPELSDRAFLVVRADVGVSRIGTVGDRLEAALDRAGAHGLGAAEIERAKSAIGSMLERGAGSCAFWSDRLARLGATGQRVEDVWSIRSSYGSMDTAEVNAVFSDWHARGTHVRVEFVGDD